MLNPRMADGRLTDDDAWPNDRFEPADLPAGLPASSPVLFKDDFRKNASLRILSNFVIKLP